MLLFLFCNHSNNEIIYYLKKISHNADLMLVHSCRQWNNIKPALSKLKSFIGNVVTFVVTSNSTDGALLFEKHNPLHLFLREGKHG